MYTLSEPDRFYISFRFDEIVLGRENILAKFTSLWYGYMIFKLPFCEQKINHRRYILVFSIGTRVFSDSKKDVA